MIELKNDAHDGGEVAAITRRNIEKRIGKSIVTSEKAIDFKNKKQIESK